jgi:hypothetical protein
VNVELEAVVEDDAFRGADAREAVRYWRKAGLVGVDGDVFAVSVAELDRPEFGVNVEEAVRLAISDQDVQLIAPLA